MDRVRLGCERHGCGSVWRRVNFVFPFLMTVCFVHAAPAAGESDEERVQITEKCCQVMIELEDELKALAQRFPILGGMDRAEMVLGQEPGMGDELNVFCSFQYGKNLKYGGEGTVVRKPGDFQKSEPMIGANGVCLSVCLNSRDSLPPVFTRRYSLSKKFKDLVLWYRIEMNPRDEKLAEAVGKIVERHAKLLKQTLDEFPKDRERKPFFTISTNAIYYVVGSREPEGKARDIFQDVHLKFRRDPKDPKSFIMSGSPGTNLTEEPIYLQSLFIRKNARMKPVDESQVAFFRAMDLPPGALSQRERHLFAARKIDLPETTIEKYDLRGKLLLMIVNDPQPIPESDENFQKTLHELGIPLKGKEFKK